MEQFELKNTTSPEGIQFQQKCIIIVGTVIAGVACILNSLALIIFIRYKSSSANSGLTILTVIEILLTVSRVVSDALLLANTGGLLFPYMFTVTSVFLCLRNWWIAVITVCRSVAILKPLKANRILTPRRQALTLILIMCISVMLNSLRQVWFFDYRSSAQDMPVFIFQVGLPVPIVVITSLSMVVYLASTASGRGSMPQTMRTVRRASHTVLQLAGVFTLLQSPGLIQTVVVTSLNLAPQMMWNAVCNLLSVTDSSANFVIFLVNSRNFQRGLYALFYRVPPGSMTTHFERSQQPLTRGLINSVAPPSEGLPMRGVVSRRGSPRYLDPNNIVYHFPANRFEPRASIHTDCGMETIDSAMFN